jgi:hypothetical protein
MVCHLKERICCGMGIGRGTSAIDFTKQQKNRGANVYAIQF